MISKEMLKKAAAEADQAIRDSLPAPAECEHQFSPSFQRKMRRTFRKAKHPVIYKLPKYAACFVLAVALASGTWLTVDAEARAAFFAWVREQYESFVEYGFIGEPPQKSNVVEYDLTWLPGEFHLIDADDSGQRITFSYSHGDNATSLFVASDYTEVKSVQVGNIKADFYQAGEEASANVLVWLSEEDTFCFCIMADLSEDTMIKLAENVKKNNSKIFKQLSKMTSFIRLRDISE